MKTLIGLYPLAFLLLLAGCDRDEKRQPTFAVSGKVTDATGKPVANVSVSFHPTAGGADVVKPRGKTDANGVFQLTTYDGNDGAPAGEYKVSVEQWITTNPDFGPVNQLPAKYANPDQSSLKATVHAGANELQPFQIKR